MTEVEWIDIFANNLRDILKDRKMSQKELANEIWVTEATISRYINKQRMPSIKHILEISYALNIDVNELIDFGEPIR